MLQTTKHAPLKKSKGKKQAVRRIRDLRTSKSNRELFHKEFEELCLLGWASLQLGGDLNHWSNDVLVAQLREFALASGVVKRGDLRHDVTPAGVSQGGMLQSRKGIAAIFDSVGDSKLVVSSPCGVEGSPFLLRELVGFRGHAIVLACSNQMFRVIATSEVPICSQLATSFKIERLRDVRLGINGEICMSKFVSPFVVGVCDDDGWYFRGGNQVTRAIDGVAMER